MNDCCEKQYSKYNSQAIVPISRLSLVDYISTAVGSSSLIDPYYYEVSILPSASKKLMVLENLQYLHQFWRYWRFENNFRIKIVIPIIPNI